MFFELIVLATNTRVLVAIDSDEAWAEVCRVMEQLLTMGRGFTVNPSGDQTDHTAITHRELAEMVGVKAFQPGKGNPVVVMRPVTDDEAIAEAKGQQSPPIVAAVRRAQLSF